LDGTTVFVVVKTLHQEKSGMQPSTTGGYTNNCVFWDDGDGVHSTEKSFVTGVFATKEQAHAVMHAEEKECFEIVSETEQGESIHHWNTFVCTTFCMHEMKIGAAAVMPSHGNSNNNNAQNSSNDRRQGRHRSNHINNTNVGTVPRTSRPRQQQRRGETEDGPPRETVTVTKTSHSATGANKKKRGSL
jgi:hypothetical protein